MLEQLRDLLCECQAMAAGGEEVWSKDVEALEWAIRILENKESCMNCLFEYHCDWQAAGENGSCTGWRPEAFGLTGTRELTVEQAAEWWDRYYALRGE